MKITAGILAASTVILSGCATINRTIHPTHHEISFSTEIRDKGDRTLPDLKDLKECKEVRSWIGDMRPDLLAQGYIELDKTFLEENEIFPLHDLSYYDAYTSSRSYRDRDGLIRTNTTTIYDRKWADVYLKQEDGRNHYKVLVKGHWSPKDTSRVNCAWVEEFVQHLEQTIKATGGRQAYLYGCRELREEIGLLTDKTGVETDSLLSEINKKGLLTQMYVDNVYREDGDLHVAASCQGGVLANTARFKVKIPRKFESKFVDLRRGQLVPLGLSRIRKAGAGSFTAQISSDLTSASIALRSYKQDYSSKIF